MRTLKELKKSVENYINKYGEDAPVGAWIYVREDVTGIEECHENGEVIYPYSDEFADKVIANLDNYDCIYEEIFDCIENEIKHQKSQEK